MTRVPFIRPTDTILYANRKNEWTAPKISEDTWHKARHVSHLTPEGGNKYKTVFWLSGRIWKGKVYVKNTCVFFENTQQYQVIYVYTGRSKLTWIITQVATIKTFLP